MADIETKSEEKRRKKSKRKHITTTEDNQNERVSKTPRRIITQQNDKDKKPFYNQKKPGGIWDNLDLILSLQNKDLDLQRKLELAFNFVKKEGDDCDESRETVSYSRVILFLNEWIQSLLISSEKKIDDVEAFLDIRSWEVFKFCLNECLSLKILLSFSPNILRALLCVVRNVLVRKDVVFVEEDCVCYCYYEVVCDCVVFMFSQRGRVVNANVDLWVSLITAVVDLVRYICVVNIVGGNLSSLLLRLSCVVFEPFANFLKVHPSPKNVFPVFVDKLLEPFLSLLTELYSQTGRNISIWNLVKLVEEILSNGLFHPAHVDGYLITRSIEKYVEPNAGKVKNSKTVIKSYHRHFFQKLDKIIFSKTSTLGAVGELFHLFVVRLKKQKGVQVLSDMPSDVTEMTGETGFSSIWAEDTTGTVAQLLAGTNNTVSGTTASASRLDVETSKLVFDLFVHFLDPLMLNFNKYSETALDEEQMLLDAHYNLKSVNRILSSFMREKIFSRMEDSSEGAFIVFMKAVFQSVISFCSKLRSIWPSLSKTDNYRSKDLLLLVAKEIINSLGYFLEIEYEVVENDLVILWLIIFAFSEIDLSLMGTVQKCSLTSDILHLGCQLVNIYSELRQVNNPIFSLCKAIRIFGFCEKDDEKNYSRFTSNKLSSSETCVESVTMLLCSKDFRLAISSAITLIPEGQVSGCIRELKMDISETLEWIKVDCVNQFGKSHVQTTSMSELRLQPEFLGRLLPEIYTIMLDCSVLTAGNCILVGNSIKDLMTVVNPNLSSLVGKNPDSVNESVFSTVVKKFAIDEMCEDKNDIPAPGCTFPWISLFFFRVYISCRSLFRQSISLMPPNLSKKSARSMGDFLTGNCGSDWLNEIDWKAEGYFSWINESSVPVLMILQSVSESCIRYSITECAPLIYVLHAMALQRLVDLNKQIKGFEFLHEKVVRLVEMKVADNSGSRLCHKKSKKYEKRISVLRQEAADIASFLVSRLPNIVKKVRPIPTDDTATSDGNETQRNCNEWDLSVCSINEKSLPTAIWWILCQNTDIWCSHAAKKKLRKFLSCLLQSFSSYVSISEDVGEQKMDGLDNLRKVTLHQISLALLNDTVFYEESFLCRHWTSRFCHFLKESALPLFSDSFTKDASFDLVPNWSEVLSKLEEVHVLMNKGLVGYHPSREAEGIPSKLPSVKGRKQLRILQNLLSLLSWMPKGHMSSKSFILYATYILNLERLVVLSLLSYHSETCLLNHSELFRLFVYSRRALKCLVMAYCEAKIEIGLSSTAPILSESSFSTLWLLKSVTVVAPLLHAYSDEHVWQVKHVFFSLMDHTSYLFLTLSKAQCRIAVNSLFENKICRTELLCCGMPNTWDNSNDPDTKFEGSDTCDIWKVVILMAETLKEQTQSLCVSLKTMFPSGTENCFSIDDLNRLSSMISCFQGFLWGLASVLNNTYLKHTEEKKPMRWKFARNSKLKDCMILFEDFINFSLHAIVVEEQRQSDDFCSDQSLPLPLLKKDSLILNYRSPVLSGDGTEISSVQKLKNNSQRKDILASYAGDDHDNTKRSDTNGVNCVTRRKKKLQLTADILTEVDSFEWQKLKTTVLQSLLEGEHPELAFLIRELYLASAAILRLKLQTGYSNLSPRSIAIIISTSRFLLSKFADMDKAPDPFSFVWLDGVLKYIEVLGSLINNTSSRDLYVKLIDIHLRAIGRIISLQGKRATLASHESESSTKTLGSQSGSLKVTLGHGPHSLDEFKARLRMSFKGLIKKPLELDLLTALDRALVGVQEGCSMVYDINTGSSCGGKVSSIVAAGVECFYLVLESVSGDKRSNVVKGYTEKLLGSLFNIILHLNGPHIFHVTLTCFKIETGPDPGSVILMCVEVLTKVAGKPSMFRMGECHVGQSFRVPAALFQDIHRLKFSKSPFNFLMFSDDLAGSEHCAVDQQFSVDLYAACCRLLCTVLRHHTSESERCIFLLEDSVCVLLQCLETVDPGSSGRKGCFTWCLQEELKCASFLRRIYEEKETLNTVLTEARDASRICTSKEAELLNPRIILSHQLQGRCYKFPPLLALFYITFEPLKPLDTIQCNTLHFALLFREFWETDQSGCREACEVREQKEVLKPHFFLSNYIAIYSGDGPSKTGIRREIDDALRPGVYALIDACSADELQQLHTGFGEGRCRSTLADLQRDYKQNFQYEGKV